MPPFPILRSHHRAPDQAGNLPQRRGPAHRKRMVRAGLGTTVFGAFSISSDVVDSGLVARPIAEPNLRRPLVLLSRPGLSETLRIKVRTILRNVF
jgi:DNA-binding transcriptional LysR family regulator